MLRYISRVIYIFIRFMNTVNGGQGRDFSAVRHVLNLKFWDNYMMGYYLGISGREKHFHSWKTDDLSDTPNTKKKPSAFNLHTSCDLCYDRTK